jgi:quinol monooxygenase YgiN
MRDVIEHRAILAGTRVTQPDRAPARRGAAFRILGGAGQESPIVTISVVAGSQSEGGPMSTLEVSAHLRVRAGQLEGFKKQAAECIRITREKDTHTLRYDWFLSSDGECEVRETYTGPEGLIEHNKNILEARTKLFNDYADGHFMTIYGEPVPELVELAKATHMEQHMKFFTFVKGLESASR